MLFGPFNFDAIPLGPAGCCVLIHNKPSLHQSWDFRAQDGIYVGPALQHYHCYRVLTKELWAVIVSDAVKFRPHNLPSPHVTTVDKIIHALQAIKATLGRMSPAPADDQLHAIETLCTILKQYFHRPCPAPPPGVPHMAPPPGVPQRIPMPPAPGRIITTDASPPPDQDDTWIPVLQGQRHSTNGDGPIATRTRARLATPNRFALLTDSTAKPTPDAATKHMAKCMALPILDPASSRMLEHCQFRTHPDYKSIWDTSYANELGRLC